MSAADKRHEALRYHEEGRPGKIQVVPTKPTENQRDLSLAYSPGVAVPCLAIRDDPELAYRYTARGNLVAVVSNGTAVLGLGNIGPLAGKPVMEGKGLLFKKFADIDVFDLEINAADPEDVIRFCRMLEPTVGGINLEDISAPACFEIERRLREELEIPVFHDDQHGTAIISGAALLNALELIDKKLDEVRVVFMGAGAAAIATAEHYVRLGVKREHVTMCDRKGAIHAGRDDLDAFKARFAREGGPKTLEEAFDGADVFVGLSVAGAIGADLLKKMARDPLVFALANPDPEVLPEDALAVRPDAIIATGRSDYPNQINNVLGFPFIFRGALDVRARGINEEMKMAATRALAELAREDVPDSVLHAYGVESMRFGRDYLIPKPFDSRVLLYVAPAVAQAAISSGVARIELDMTEYRTTLESRLGRGREIMRGLSNRAAALPQRVALGDAADARVLRAARILADEKIVRPVLLGPVEGIRASAAQADVPLDDLEIVDPRTSPLRAEYAEALWTSRQRKGVTRAEALRRMADAAYFGAMMVVRGDADALVVGQAQHYPHAIRPALEAAGASRNLTVAGIYMMIFPDRTLFFADCTVHIDPTAEELAEIARATAAFVRKLGVDPQVALLSFSNFGSVSNDAARRVSTAVGILHERHPELSVDGEMQADTAVVKDLLKGHHPFTRLREAPNVLIFPDLNAANISYKLLRDLGGAVAIGPILVGMAAPIHVLQRGSSVDDIVNMAVIAAVDAQERARRAPAAPSERSARPTTGRTP